MFFKKTPFPRCGYSVHFPRADGEELSSGEGMPDSFEGPLPGKYQNIDRAELFAVMMMMLSVTNYNVRWYSDSQYCIKGFLALLENPVHESIGARSNGDLWTIAVEIVAQFKRFFTLDCRFVASHSDKESSEPGKQFEAFANAAADEKAKSGAKMHPDFFKVEDGLKDWQVFQDSMSRQAEEREDAMNQRAAQGLRQVHDGTFAQNLQSEAGPRFEGGGELDGVGTCSRKRPAHPADQPKRRGCAPHHPPRSSNLPTEPRSSNLRTEMPAPILPPETDRMFAQWQSAKRARDYVTADKLREELRQLVVDADLRDGRPSRAPVVQAGEGSSDGARMEELLSQRSGYQEPGPPQVTHVVI
jgi:ribonuclease HI